MQHLILVGKTIAMRIPLVIPVFNQNNSYYCSCKSGYYGKNCSMYEPLCETYCSANALCRLDDSDLQAKKNKPYCICPLGHFGPRCNLKYDECNSNPCLNNGTCFSNYDPSGENPYMCICSERFYGNQCQNEKASVHIDLNMTKTLSARATVVQLYDYYTPYFYASHSSISKFIMACHRQLDTTILISMHLHLEFSKFMKIYHIHNILSCIFCINRRLISLHLHSIVHMLHCCYPKVSFFHQ